MARVSHPTNIRCRGHGYVPHQASCHCVVVEHQGVRGGECPLALSILNISQFIMNEEAAGGVGEPHWFVAYSHALQWMGEVAHGRKWEWLRREALKIKASLLVHAF